MLSPSDMWDLEIIQNLTNDTVNFCYFSGRRGGRVNEKLRPALDMYLHSTPQLFTPCCLSLS